jgi:hypothetical protein
MRRFLTVLAPAAPINNGSGDRAESTKRGRKASALAAVLLFALTGSPAFATQPARHDVHYRFAGQKADAYRHPTFSTGIPAESREPHRNGANTTRDDWPANMILG